MTQAEKDRRLAELNQKCQRCRDDSIKDGFKPPNPKSCLDICPDRERNTQTWKSWMGCSRLGFLPTWRLISQLTRRHDREVFSVMLFSYYVFANIRKYGIIKEVNVILKRKVS